MKILKIKELLNKGYKILKEEKIESYILDCQLILGKVLNLDRMSIIINGNLEVSEDKAYEYFELIKKRKLRMPIKYITETVEFMGIDFYIKEGVLIPRPDTEVLVEEVLKEINKRKLKKVCDVCCGSGAIGLSIAKLLENTIVVCSDIDDTALEVTQKNIDNLSLKSRASVVKSDLLKFAIDENLYFDVVVSNPPYIKKDIIPTLMEDVKKYEPYIALCGGEDGLDFYKKITKESILLLKSGGVLAYEIGYDQAEAVSDILKQYNYTDIRVVKDLSGLDRVVIGVKI
ncbi:peptide chain release factor N(5)-glutamine methyltransferase [Clostridium prolinivorans]|uniref:peptide chain release factor N(5)-glutamine methyltransferase n=1 Tax=Clostridium prolinivorans TaxID=2769420 RepID=UPI002B05619C|nr:peptide chain release factor N(5)-glutamine methyltransferase [Clostridium prolinivorans]